MRSAISVLGMLASQLLVAACFDPTRPCGSDADCVNGGTCDPGTKTCVAAGNPNDKTPPVFSIVVTPPPLRQDTAKLTEYDPGSPDGGRDAFRRDESVELTVTSGDHDVDAGSVKLLAHGVAAGAGTAVDVPLAPCAPSNPAASNPFCREGTVQLAPLPFDAFRAVVPLEVTGADLSNNVGSADAGVNVTRWKWRYSAGAPIYTTPAIADDGTIVFGTSDGGSGSVYALAADGDERWTPVSAGPDQGESRDWERSTADNNLRYVATAASGGRLFAVDRSRRLDRYNCPSGASGVRRAIPRDRQLLVTSGATSFEGALGSRNGERLVNIRPGPAYADDRCLSAPKRVTQSFPSNRRRCRLRSVSRHGRWDRSGLHSRFGNWVDQRELGRRYSATPVVGDRDPVPRSDRVQRRRHDKPSRCLRTGPRARESSRELPGWRLSGRSGIRGRQTRVSTCSGAASAPSPLLYSASPDLQLRLCKSRECTADRRSRCGPGRSRVPGHRRTVPRSAGLTLRRSAGQDRSARVSPFSALRRSVAPRASGSASGTSLRRINCREFLRNCRRQPRA